MLQCHITSFLQTQVVLRKVGKGPSHVLYGQDEPVPMKEQQKHTFWNNDSMGEKCFPDEGSTALSSSHCEQRDAGFVVYVLFVREDVYLPAPAEGATLEAA
jgi:hypothetical protein